MTKKKSHAAPHPGFVAKLKRHHLFRVMTLYATGAWVLILVTNQVFPDFGLRREDVRYLIAALALLFPAALALAWTFIPPSREDPKTFSRWKRLRWRLGIAFSVVLLAFAAGTGGYLWKSYSRPLPAAAPVLPVAEPTTLSPQSIAVLPFENLSGDQDNAYFSAGTQDEILTRLAQIGSLKVISRTSTLKYASHPEDVKSIGRELGVATVLEGSVQRMKDQVRVNVQLIDARTDTHLWAQVYDQDVKDIFAAESDIAAKIADQLKVELAPEEREGIAMVPTRVPAAYDVYLKAEYLYDSILDQSASGHRRIDTMQEAVVLYTRAIALDPGFAVAYAHRSRLESLLFLADVDRKAVGPAREDAKKALALAPDSPEAHLAMGYLHLQGEQDYPKALAEFETVAQNHPNDAATILAIAKVHRRLGKFALALTELGHALALDPGNRSIYLKFISNSYEILGHYRLAETALKPLDRPDSNDPSVRQLIAETQVLSGRLADAKATLDSVPPADVEYGWDGFWAYNIARFERDPQAMLKIAKRLSHPGQDLEVMVMLGDSYALTGDAREAAATYAKLDAIERPILPANSDDDFLNMTYSRLEAAWGHKAEAIAAAEKAVALTPVSGDPVNGPYDLYNLAVIEVRVGAADAALTHLAELMAGPHGQAVSVAVLKLDPRWDPVRSDLRFVALLDKYAASED